MLLPCAAPPAWMGVALGGACDPLLLPHAAKASPRATAATLRRVADTGRQHTAQGANRRHCRRCSDYASVLEVNLLRSFAALAALLLVPVLGGACRGAAREGPATPSPGSASGMSPTASASASAVAPATTASVTPAAALPPIDEACKSAADCGYAYTYLIDGKCCDGTCSPKPASRSWLEAAQAQCKKLGWEEQQCPAKKCVPPPELECVSGRCVASSP